MADNRPYGLYGAFVVKGACIAPLFVLSLHSFVRPAPRAFFRPDRYYHRRRAQRGSRTALVQRRRKLALTNASTAAGCP
jgi:hypothetical protein